MKSLNKRQIAPLTLSLLLAACSSPTGTPPGERTLKKDASQTQPELPTHDGLHRTEQKAGQAVRSLPSIAPLPAVVPIPTTLPVPAAVPQSFRESEDASLASEMIANTAPQARRLSKQQASGTAHYRHPVAPPRVYPPHPPYDHYTQPQPDHERYPDATENSVKQVASTPVSTFSIDVDTAAYANARRQLNGGQLPRSESVRVEEFINYFNYSYPQPTNNEGPFSITTEVGPSPWNADRKLMLVGLQGYEVEREELPPANLVFLIDVSGSMNQPNKLGLLKSSLKMLTRGLGDNDSISIAVYAGAAGEVLAPTRGSNRNKIMQAIDQLHAGGSTNGGAGINLAYALAQKNFNKEGINRVILATDGDFNVGTTNVDSLRRLIEKKRDTGVSLTVLGFGAGNYNDALMQELAQKGNGNAAYIDTVNEARKVLVDEIGSTLQTIAKDVKIQVEFNPRQVQEYRLIGYETRALKREDFNNDRIDAGEIGAGHSVTALYELTLTGAERPAVDNLRYANKTQDASNSQARRSTSTTNSTTNSTNNTRAASNELAYVKLRYKEPEGRESKLLTRVVHTSDLSDRISQTSDNFRFASAASAFGQLLRGSNYTGDFGYRDALLLARKARGVDEFGYRHEFEQLLRTASELAPLNSRGHSNEHEEEKDLNRQRS